MNDTLYITKESIMNFERDCVVKFGHRIGTVMRVDNKNIIVQFQDRNFTEPVYYSFLKIIEYKRRIFSDPKRPWLPEDVKILLDNLHLSNVELRLLLGRTVSSITMYKNSHGLQKKYHGLDNRK